MSLSHCTNWPREDETSANMSVSSYSASHLRSPWLRISPTSSSTVSLLYFHCLSQIESMFLWSGQARCSGHGCHGSDMFGLRMSDRSVLQTNHSLSLPPVGLLRSPNPTSQDSQEGEVTRRKGRRAELKVNRLGSWFKIYSWLSSKSHSSNWSSAFLSVKKKKNHWFKWSLLIPLGILK